jgi:hypothetical protein
MKDDIEYYFSTETLMSYTTPCTFACRKVLEQEGSLYYIDDLGTLCKWTMGSNIPMEIVNVDVANEQPKHIRIFGESYIKLSGTAYIDTHDLRVWYDKGDIMQTCEYEGRKFVITITPKYSNGFYPREYMRYTICLYADKRLVKEEIGVFVYTEAKNTGISEMSLIKTRYRYLRNGIFQFGGDILTF